VLCHLLFTSESRQLIFIDWLTVWPPLQRKSLIADRKKVKHQGEVSVPSLRAYADLAVTVFRTTQDLWTWISNSSDLLSLTAAAGLSSDSVCRDPWLLCNCQSRVSSRKYLQKLFRWKNSLRCIPAKLEFLAYTVGLVKCSNFVFIKEICFGHCALLYYCTLV